MNKNDFRNPLIKSGIILLCAFFLISIVANSSASSFFDGIAVIFIAIFKAILFIFGLSIALVCSIAVLIGIYRLCAYFYSSDKESNIFNQLKNELKRLYCNVRRCKNSSEEKTSVPTANQDTLESQPSVKKKETPFSPRIKPELFENRVSALEKQTGQIQSSMDSVKEVLESIQKDIEELKNSSTDIQTKIISTLEATTKKNCEKLETQAQTIDTINANFESIEEQIKNNKLSVKAEMSDLRKKATVPEVISGILSYIDTPKDREKLTKTVEEAVSRGMTYNQADGLFKKELSAKNYKILAAHPRLTKDFIRSVKKKFA